MALEMLKAENELLRAAVIEGGEGSGELKKPEDFWSPSIEVPDGVEYVEPYGPISPVPNHDGTECFKWDNTLWKKADHFKVSLKWV